MRIMTLLAAVALLLAGCATAPPLPQIESRHGDRVGVLVDISDTPAHTHVGTTVFNNFVKQYPYNWKLRERVYETVTNRLAKAGFTPVDLKAEGVKYSEVAGLIQADGEKWSIGAGKEHVYKKLHDQMKLKALVVLKEARVKTMLECSGGPCSVRYADKSGLFTRSVFNLDSYYAVAAYKWHVYVLDPIADTTTASPLRQRLVMPVSLLSNHFRSDASGVGFKPPSDFKNISMQEFAPVEKAILNFTDSVSGEVVNSLAPK